MSKRTILVLCVVLVCLVAGIAYLRQRTYNHYNAGEVTSLEPRESTNPATPEPVTTHTSHKEPAGHPMDEPAAVTPAPQTTPSTGNDSLSPEPPNGAAFAGSGRFQVYRQGDLTWRLDTDSGETCVLFATDDEWQNPRVYRRACGRS